MYRQLDPHITQAIDAIKQASVLIGGYLEKVRRLGAKNLLSGTRFDSPSADFEELLLGLDQEFSALWAKLDEARQLFRFAGLSTAAYDALRSRVGQTALGYQEEHKGPSTGEVVASVLVGTSLRFESRWWVTPEQVELTQQALAALRAELPGVDWQVTLDDEAERFLRSQRRSNWLWKDIVIISFIAIILAFALILCGR
jgi:hypothetical protein